MSADSRVAVVYRYASSGALHRWEFSKGGKKRSVAVRPAFVANGSDVLLRAALGGVGLTYQPDLRDPFVGS